MLINGPIQNLLSKFKEEWPEVISRLLFTFVTYKLQEYLNLCNTFSYLFHNFDVTSSENIHSITFWKYAKSFNYKFCRSFWYSFGQPLNDKRLSWPCIHLVVLYGGPSLTTGPLLFMLRNINIVYNNKN